MIIRDEFDFRSFEICLDIPFEDSDTDGYNGAEKHGNWGLSAVIPNC